MTAAVYHVLFIIQSYAQSQKVIFFLWILTGQVKTFLKL